MEDGLIDIEYCPSSEMVADLLTKPVSCSQFEQVKSLMCLGTTMHSMFMKWEGVVVGVYYSEYS